MKKILDLFFLGQLVVFPKYAVYIISGLSVLSMSKKINGDVAYFDGDLIIGLGLFILFMALAAIIYNIIRFKKL